MEQHFRNYQINHKVQEKNRILLLEIEKKKSKKLPYLNNSSEEAIFGSNRIKEQYNTMKV